MYKYIIRSIVGEIVILEDIGAFSFDIGERINPYLRRMMKTMLKMGVIRREKQKVLVWIIEEAMLGDD